MSKASERGKNYESKIQKLTQRILKLEVKRDPRSGAGDWHKQDIRDRYGELPLSIEVKDQETLKLKEWWRDASDKASFNQAPVVVFPADSEDLCIMRYTDLLQLVRESLDWRETAQDLQKPSLPPDVEVELQKQLKVVEEPMKRQMATKLDRMLRSCLNGHSLPEGRDKCQWKGCKFSATYLKPKEPRAK